MSDMTKFLKNVATGRVKDKCDYKSKIEKAKKYVENLCDDDSEKIELWMLFSANMLLENENLTLDNISKLGFLVENYLPIDYIKEYNAMIVTGYDITSDDMDGRVKLLSVIPKEDGPKLQSSLTMVNTKDYGLLIYLSYDRGTDIALMELETDLSPIQEYLCDGRDTVFRRTYPHASMKEGEEPSVEYDEEYFKDDEINPEELYLYEENGKVYAEVYRDLVNHFVEKLGAS